MRIIGLTFGVILFLLVLLVYWAIADHLAWQEYIVEHECAKTGNSESYYVTTYVQSGKVLVPVMRKRNKYEWRCEAPTEILWR